MTKLFALLILLLHLPFVAATHTDIPYNNYNRDSQPVYNYGTDIRYGYTNYYLPTSYHPYYNAGYRQGKLYEREGFTREYEIRGEDRDDYYGYSRVNDRYKEKESYERTREYDYDQSGRFFSRYDPRYDGRRGRTLSRDYDEGYYRPSLYGSGHLAMEDAYGPVQYNYRGQRYGYDKEGRRFYY